MINVVVHIEGGCCTSVEATEDGHEIEFELDVIDHDAEHVGDLG
ncbi:MAG: hypothetical protein WC919_00170 [Candidatus Paceibacterota bacterium]|jgi:hypothetical protein